VQSSHRNSQGHCRRFIAIAISTQLRVKWVQLGKRGEIGQVLVFRLYRYSFCISQQFANLVAWFDDSKKFTVHRADDALDIILNVATTGGAVSIANENHFVRVNPDFPAVIWLVKQHKGSCSQTCDLHGTLS
jgi:hypothetical protein